MNRRQFLFRVAAGALGASALTSLYAWRVEPHWVEFVHHRLPVAHLPANLAGRTLVQLSDFHVGPRVDSAYIVRTCRRVAELHADFVVFTGDFITYRTPKQLDQLSAVLEHFPHGRLGTVAILGNHDYGHGWSHAEIAAQVVVAAERAGIHVLRNAGTQIHGLQFVGLDDLWADRFEPEPAFRDADPAAATIALSHNPDTVDRAGWDWHRGWVFSGHTHGGQCKPPFLPPPLLPVENKRYTAGEFGLRDGRRLYISRGVGHLIRVRFNVRPEVTIHHLDAI